MQDRLEEIVGKANVAQGSDLARWSRDWTGVYTWTPLAVVRPGSTAEVAAILRLANETGTAVVPVSGNTGLAGGTTAEGAIMLSLDRMNRIREVRPAARIAIVEAGVILSSLHEAADAHGMIFPLTFGARGSAMVGGFLSTNAGGSNVLRYGNTRDLCLGLEVVLPTGEVMDLMSELHKDNSGYNLKHLMIGAEGTLGIITAAVLKLAPKPRAYATAMVAAPSLDQALVLLNLAPASWAAYRIGLPKPGHWREVLNSDSAHYGGGDCGNAGGVDAQDLPWHNQPWSAEFTLPPLSCLVFLHSC